MPKLWLASALPMIAKTLEISAHALIRQVVHVRRARRRISCASSAGRGLAEAWRSSGIRFIWVDDNGLDTPRGIYLLARYSTSASMSPGSSAWPALRMVHMPLCDSPALYFCRAAFR